MKFRGVTLIELIVAITLLGLILLTGAVMDIASRRFFNVSDRQAELQNEVNPVILRIKRDINQATGDVASGPGPDPGILIGANSIAIRLDVDINGDSNWDSSDDYTDDNWVVYQLAGSQILYFPFSNPPATSAPEVISNRIINFTPTSINSIFVPGFPRGAQVSLTACFDPLGDCSGADVNNPILTLTTSAHAISQSAR